MSGDVVPEVEIEVEADPASRTTQYAISPSTTNTSSSGSGTGSGLGSGSVSGAGTGSKPPDKTISCVSCRKRKLRCDRVKPKCGTCERLRHECEYPERRRNPGSKRRNMKELEERLAQVETKLVSEVPNPNMPRPFNFNMKDNSNASLEDLDFSAGQIPIDESLNLDQWGFTFQSAPPPVSLEDPFSQELISLGLEEPLPPQEMINELHDIYFERCHKIMPMIHKYRYFASLDRAPHMRAPVCLQYAMWTAAASVSEKYSCYQELLYSRARRYMEAAEMNGHGENFVTVYHAQAWGLISNYEAKQTFFSRSWMSTGRMSRLCMMLGLHRLDGDQSDVKQILGPPSDWIELEERRRTFWIAFHNDRCASSGTGWPMTINEKEILTNLPSSEHSFEQGIPQETPSLADALTPEGAPKVSTFGGVVLSAALFGHNFQHLHRIGPNERPDDPCDGEFWKRHRKMDNVLSDTFLFLPDHLRLPGGLGDLNVVFLHLNIHASTICLHQAAIVTAERHNLHPSVTQQSHARSLMAAQEVANIARLIRHVNTSNLSSWMSFSLFVAAGVLLQDLKADEQDVHPQSLINLEFLLATLRAMADNHAITRHFTAQLELDIEAAVMSRSQPAQDATEDPSISNASTDRLSAEKKEMQKRVNIMRFFSKRLAGRSGGPSGAVPIANILACLPGMGLTSSDQTRTPMPNGTNLQQFIPGRHRVLPAATPAIQGKKIFRDSSSFTDLSHITPSSNPPSRNPMQFPVRQCKPTDKGPFPSSQNPFTRGVPTAAFFPTVREGTNAPSRDCTNTLDNSLQTADLDAMFEDIVWDPNFI